MSLTRKIAHNTLIQFIGKALSLVLSLVTVGVMTRYLGRDGFGNYTTIIAFLQFFGIIVDFGLAVIIVQMISARPAETEKLTSNIFTFRLLTALVLFSLAPIVVWLFPYPVIIKSGVAVTAAALFFTSLNQLIIGLFQRELKMAKVVIAEIVGRAVILAGVIIAAELNWSLLAIMAAVVAGNLLQFLALWFYSRALVKIKLAFDWAVWREVFSKSWPIGLSIIFNLIYFKADTVILSLYRSQAEVGIYGASYKVLEVLSSLPYLFMGLVLPVLSAAWANHNREQFDRALQKAWDFMSLCTWPMIIGGIILARPIIVAVAGPEFTAAGGVLQILLLATAAIYWSTIFNHAVIALERQKKMLFGFFIVAVISMIGYLVFIPTYSYWAAAVVTVISEILILIISAAVVFSQTKHGLSLSVFGRSLLASVLMGGLILSAESLSQNLIWLLLVGVVSYSLLIFALGGVKKELIREVLGKNK